MIQEKDFLYRVPVKTAPITTPRGQIRNPEILVDLEGGEFMHGNILDANSTNKLINQSVKDAVDDKFTESGLQAAIATKADATALSNYVLTTALNQQIDTLNTAISAKQNAGNYIPYDSTDASNYKVDRTINITTISHTGINFETDINDVAINEDGFFVSRDSDDAHLCSFTPSGIRFAGKTTKDIPTANGTFVNSDDFALKQIYDKKIAALEARITALEAKHPEATA